MKVVVINNGSSTLKLDLLEIDPPAGASSSRKLAHGLVDRIGQPDAGFDYSTSSGDSGRRRVAARTHREAVAAALEWLQAVIAQTPAWGPGGIEVVGHRVVDGGDELVAPVLIDNRVMDVLHALVELAPLHNPVAIEGIEVARQVFGPDMPMVAVFDTAFHSTLPPPAYTYAIPYEIAEKHKIRRYGFHGIAHEYMSMRYTQLVGDGGNPKPRRIVTLQLGSGCSACAVLDGRSVDTSMGFTPVEGLVMGTRSGDIDPSLVAYIGAKEGVGPGEVTTWLNKRSGLLGISGHSNDMRDLLMASAWNPRAALAVDVFCYRVRKYIGAYLAALGGAEAVIFGGGIGENSPDIRERVCEGLEGLGLMIDPARNGALSGKEGVISAGGSPIAAFVIPVDESVLIAQQAGACFLQRSSRAG